MFNLARMHEYANDIIDICNNAGNDYSKVVDDKVTRYAVSMCLVQLGEHSARIRDIDQEYYEKNPELAEENTSKKADDTAEKKQEENALNYSTNTNDTVKDGNKGVYAYKMRGESYHQYYIIDFDEGYVYYFTEGNGNESCDKVKIESGTLNDVLIITYQDGGDTWSYGLHFKYKNNPETLIVEDNDHFETKFTATGLKDALAIRDKKDIHEY